MAEEAEFPQDMEAVPNYQAWRHRTMQPALMMKIERAPWADAKDLPDYQGWVKVAKRLDPKRWADRDPRYYMTRHLVDEVLFAAGGIERELQFLKDALANAQALADALEKKYPRKAGEPSPGLGMNSGLHASYAFINALTWARSVRDRVERPDPIENKVSLLGSLRPSISLMRKAKRSSPEKVKAGLVPSLTDSPLKKQIKDHLQQLDSVLQESRRITNYALHAGAPHGPGTPIIKMRPDGQVYFPVPDRRTKRVLIWDEFTYREGRDALTYMQVIFDAIAEFVDGMLGAFDKLPEPF